MTREGKKRGEEEREQGRDEDLGITMMIRAILMNLSVTYRTILSGNKA